MPAPIIVFCYNRPQHLKKTIEALRANTLAHKSSLIVFSDAARSKKDEKAVREVRDFIQSIDGFFSVTIQMATKNNGLANSVIQGVSEVFNSFDRVIVLEDDMICTPDFLEFMNDSLAFYADRNDIFSVTGYSPPIVFPEHYRHNLYLAPRTSSWGWGTWRNRWAKGLWEIKNFENIKNNRAWQEKLNRGGDDLWPMLVKQQLGIIDSWAIRWTWTQAVNEGLSVYPRYAKILNIGTDGSGTNFTIATDQYNTELVSKKIEMVPTIQPDAAVIEEFKKYHEIPVRVKLKNLVKYRIW